MLRTTAGLEATTSARWISPAALSQIHGVARRPVPVESGNATSRIVTS